MTLILSGGGNLLKINALVGARCLCLCPVMCEKRVNRQVWFVIIT